MQRITVFVVLALLTVACSGAADPGTTPATSSSTPSATTAVPDPTTSTTQPTTTIENTTTTSVISTTTMAAPGTTAATSTTLAGEPFDLGPGQGDILGVIGVAYNDVLNVRSGPGTNYSIVAQLDPSFAQMVATGQHRRLTRTIWNEVTVDGVTGWANSSFMAYLGPVDDATARYIANVFGGTIPSAPTMLDLGMLVADGAASEDPPSRITITVAPTSGDLGEITIDVVGFGDDAVVGVRLHVFGQPNGDGFSLKSIEERVMCGRGTTTDGLCP